jgi:hypothetical protein
MSSIPPAKEDSYRSSELKYPDRQGNPDGFGKLMSDSRLECVYDMSETVTLEQESELALGPQKSLTYGRVRYQVGR